MQGSDWFRGSAMDTLENCQLSDNAQLQKTATFCGDSSVPWV